MPGEKTATPTIHQGSLISSTRMVGDRPMSRRRKRKKKKRLHVAEVTEQAFKNRRL